jgi:hypothetical protein
MSNLFQTVIQSPEVRDVLDFFTHCGASHLKFLILVGFAVALTKLLKIIAKTKSLEPSELFILRLCALGLLIVEAMILFHIPFI